MIKNKNKIHIFYNGTDIHKYFTFDTATWCKEVQRKLVWSLFLPATVNIQELSVEKNSGPDNRCSLPSGLSNGAANLYRTHTRLPWRNWPRNKLTQPQSCSFWEGHQEHTLEEKTAHPTHSSGKTLRSSCRRGKLDASPSSCAKINSKQIKVLNLKPEVQPLLEENLRREHLKLEVEAKTSWTRIQAQEVIPRTDARDHMKWKCLHASREMISRERRQSEEWEKTTGQLHFLW